MSKDIERDILNGKITEVYRTNLSIDLESFSLRDIVESLTILEDKVENKYYLTIDNETGIEISKELKDLLIKEL